MTAACSCWKYGMLLVLGITASGVRLLSASPDENEKRAGNDENACVTSRPFSVGCRSAGVLHSSSATLRIVWLYRRCTLSSHSSVTVARVS